MIRASKQIYFGCDRAERRRIGKGLDEARDLNARIRKARANGLLAPPYELLACAYCGKRCPADGQCPCVKAVA